MDLERVKLTISEGQFDKLRRGQPVQVSAPKLKNGKHTIFVNPVLAKKIRSAKRANRGVRFQLSRQELELSAEGLKDFLKKAKKWYDKHVKKSVAPLLKKGVQGLAHAALTEAELIAPELAPTLEKGRKFIPQLTNKVGKVTGAFGVAQGGRQVEIEGNFHDMLGSNHPARARQSLDYFPGAITHCGGCNFCKMAQMNNLGNVKTSGSFKPAGGRMN